MGDLTRVEEFIIDPVKAASFAKRKAAVDNKNAEKRK